MRGWLSTALPMSDLFELPFNNPLEQKPLTRKQQKLINAGTAIRSQPPEKINFLHTVQCQTGLPYTNPGEHVREWDRVQGMVSMRIEAGSAIEPSTGKFVKLGLPYGEKPRLVLIHLASEAIRKKSPIVDVEDSMTAFARSLGIDTNGHHLRFLKEQLGRLSAATVRFGFREGDRTVQINTQIMKAMELWYPQDPRQKILWPSTVRLSDDYYESLTRHAVPLDRRAVAAIASSAMALDVYVWLAQRLHRVPTNKPQRISWITLHEQFGQGYDRVRDFRRQFLRTLHQVKSVYPEAHLDHDEQTLTMYHSSPPITRSYSDNILCDQ